MSNLRKRVEKNAAMLREASKILPLKKDSGPTQHQVREVLARFINDRMEGELRVTPQWIAQNHDLARRLVDQIRHDTPVSDRGPKPGISR